MSAANGHPLRAMAGAWVVALLLVTGGSDAATAGTPGSGRAQSHDDSAEAAAAATLGVRRVATPTQRSTTALAELATLRVKGRAPKTGYGRSSQYGTAWIDVDGNHCDTRNDILRRDLTDITLGERCRVLAGTLLDPYTGTTIAFVRGQATSAQVQIDHVVALSNSWQTGAQALTRDRRIQFANDPLNLLAVDGVTNQRKGDGDAATWLPPRKSYRCAYVARQVAVKARYGLWVTRAERDAITRILNTCPAQPLPH